LNKSLGDLIFTRCSACLYRNTARYNQIIAVVLCAMCYMVYIKEREVAVLLTGPGTCPLLNAIQHKHHALTHFSLFPQNVGQDIIQFYSQSRLVPPLRW